MDNFNENNNENEFNFSERLQDNSNSNKDIFSTEEIKIQNKDDIEANKKFKKENNSKHKKLNAFLSGIIGILSFLVIVLIICIVYFWKNGFNLNYQNSKNNSQTTSDAPLAEANIKFEPKPENENQLSAETIYENIAPSVVGVVVYDSEANVLSDSISQGSGIIVDQKGYIVTNSHVVNNSKKNSIKIVLNNKEEISGKVVGYDTRVDLAVIKCDKDNLPCATLGDSNQVKVGESVLALGNPMGLEFASTLTRGIVSGVNRSKSMSSSSSLVKYIQTDAAINPGNSGGPLINMYGQVIGINTVKLAATELEGMGFAIPSNVVKDVVSDIISKGYVSGRVRLGIEAKMISNYQAQMYDVPVGILISKIHSDSNLKSAGVEVGDIITKINDVNITNLDASYGELYKHKPGETVKLSIFRTSNSRRENSSTLDANVVLLEDRGETQEKEDEMYTR